MTCPQVSLAGFTRRAHNLRMEQEPLIHREELTAALFAIIDLRADVASILELLREEDDGETPEDDA